ncbi:MAG: FAD-dependent oxidoreductase [Nitrospirota bacterium]
MPPSSRYDAVIVGGGLAGVATAALLAKRGRRVALCEPRPSWGGVCAARRVGAAGILPGPRVAVGHERMGWADRYCESIGLSLPIMTREGGTFRRDAMQVIWGAHRLTVTSDRGEIAEELRREYRAVPSDVTALWADLDTVCETLSSRMEPSPIDESGPSWPRLRRAASARAFVSRFGGASTSEYAASRNLPVALVPYLDAWRSAVSSPGDAPEAWLYRVASAHRGLVALPGGLADVCALLASRFEAHGGEVIRTPVTAVGGGSDPFVETDGRRLTARAVILNSRCRPGTDGSEASPVISTAAFTVPSSCVPDAMAAYLLVSEGSETWSLARRRMEAAGGSSTDALTVSCRGRLDGKDAKALEERLVELMPFAEGRVAFDGIIRDEDAPEPADLKAWREASWRARRFGWTQAGRTPVWWIADASDPWLGDASAYRTALAVDRIVRLG